MSTDEIQLLPSGNVPLGCQEGKGLNITMIQQRENEAKIVQLNILSSLDGSNALS